MNEEKSSKEKILEIVEKDPLIYKEEVISKIGCTRSYLNRVIKSEGLAMLNRDEAPPEVWVKRHGSILNPSICFGMNESGKWCSKANPGVNRCTVYATIPHLYVTGGECPFNQRFVSKSLVKTQGQGKTKSGGNR